MIDPPTILLTTLNAKYIHPSLGLRYLLANMGDLKPQTALREFTIARTAQEVVAELLRTLERGTPALERKASGPQIVGLGVYIWNVRQTTEVVRLLKAARPDVVVILGGPEVSYEPHELEIARLADHVITGWGDLNFAKLCRALLQGASPLTKIISGEQPDLDQVVLPYAEYSDADLAHRIVYVEASRGCPFKCEFCLSALDKTAWMFDLDSFLGAMDRLYRRGARHFKFLDRTFNLKIDNAVRILQFFLDRVTTADSSDSAASLFVHFELVPDHLPAALKTIIALFPPDVLHFEVGIQSFAVEVNQRISRQQDNAQAAANLRWLVGESNAQVHADLLFGLPGETLESFAAGFDRLYALRPHETQLGVLKRLRGTPIARHTVEFGMVYAVAPPYAVRQTSTIDAATVLRVSRFARYWEIVVNSGRFSQTLSLLMDSLGSTVEGNGWGNAPDVKHSPFHAFMGLSDWLWQHTGKTHGLIPELLVDALSDYLCGECGFPAAAVQQALLADYIGSGARGTPLTLREPLSRHRRSIVGAGDTAIPPVPVHSCRLNSADTHKGYRHRILR